MPGLQIDIFNYQNHYRPAITSRLQKRLAQALKGKSYIWEKDPRPCQHICAELDQFIAAHSPDAVLMFVSEGCAYSTGGVPIYCYADSIFATRAGTSSKQKNRNGSSVSNGLLV